MLSRLLFVLLLTTTLSAMPSPSKKEDLPPTHLYKVLSRDNWQKSQGKECLVLDSEDAAFIHLAREDQLERITAKFWSNVPEYLILKLRTDQLPGRLVFESNLGGTNKYYHLYDGCLPLSSIKETTSVKR